MVYFSFRIISTDKLIIFNEYNLDTTIIISKYNSAILKFIRKNSTVDNLSMYLFAEFIPEKL